MTKTYTFTVDGETYKMTIEEMAECLTKGFAKTILTEKEFESFCKAQNDFFEEQRRKAEEYSRTHYIYDELGSYSDL